MSHFTKLLHGDCLKQLSELEDDSIDSIVTDPPYGLSFMGKKWDYDVPSVDIWIECLRVLKPGGHLLAFAGTRTQHRMAVNIEDAGFEIRDMIAWVYGSGFPKSLNIGKAVDKLQGNERKELNERGGAIQKGSYNWQGEDRKDGKGSGFNEKFIETKGNSEWEGWGTALKPSLEPITVARKPIKGTVADNVLKWGTGGLNIDECRVGKEALPAQVAGQAQIGTFDRKDMVTPEREGRFPANLIHDGSDEVEAVFPQTGKSRPDHRNEPSSTGDSGIYGKGYKRQPNMLNDSGSAARFFYCAKASKSDRDEGCEGLNEKKAGAMSGKEYREDRPTNHPMRRNHHPTVKPTDLMRYLVKLVTPPNGIVLDPFMGSGSTGKACVSEGFSFIGIEMEQEYMDIAEARIERQKQKGIQKTMDI